MISKNTENIAALGKFPQLQQILFILRQASHFNESSLSYFTGTKSSQTQYIWSFISLSFANIAKIFFLLQDLIFCGIFNRNLDWNSQI